MLRLLLTLGAASASTGHFLFSILSRAIDFPAELERQRRSLHRSARHEPSAAITCAGHRLRALLGERGWPSIMLFRYFHWPPPFRGFAHWLSRRRALMMVEIRGHYSLIAAGRCHFCDCLLRFSFQAMPFIPPAPHFMIMPAISMLFANTGLFMSRRQMPRRSRLLLLLIMISFAIPSSTAALAAAIC